jgi:hypothetical protein
MRGADECRPDRRGREDAQTDYEQAPPSESIVEHGAGEKQHWERKGACRLKGSLPQAPLGSARTSYWN